MKKVRIVELDWMKPVEIDDDEFVVDIKFVFQNGQRGTMYAVVVKGETKRK